MVPWELENSYQNNETDYNKEYELESADNFKLSADATGRAKDFQSFARLLEKKQNSTTPGFYKEKKMPEKDFRLPKLNEQTNKKEEADEHTNKEKESDEQTKNSQDTKTTQDKAKKSKYQKDQK